MSKTDEQRFFLTTYVSLGGTGEEEEELDSNETSRQLKPWGYTRHFCPVALRTADVLWPGNHEISLR